MDSLESSIQYTQAVFNKPRVVKTFSKRFPKQVIEKHHFLTPETPHTALLQVHKDSRSEKIKNSIARNISTKNLNDVTNNKNISSIQSSHSVNKYPSHHTKPSSNSVICVSIKNAAGRKSGSTTKDIKSVKVAKTKKEKIVSCKRNGSQSSRAKHANNTVTNTQTIEPEISDFPSPPSLEKIKIEEETRNEDNNIEEERDINHENLESLVANTAPSCNLDLVSMEMTSCAVHTIQVPTLVITEEDSHDVNSSLEAVYSISDKVTINKSVCKNQFETKTAEALLENISVHERRQVNDGKEKEDQQTMEKEETKTTLVPKEETEEDGVEKQDVSLERKTRKSNRHKNSTPFKMNTAINEATPVVQPPSHIGSNKRSKSLTKSLRYNKRSTLLTKSLSYTNKDTVFHQNAAKPPYIHKVTTSTNKHPHLSSQNDPSDPKDASSKLTKSTNRDLQTRSQKSGSTPLLRDLPVTSSPVGKVQGQRSSLEDHFGNLQLTPITSVEYQQSGTGGRIHVQATEQSVGVEVSQKKGKNGRSRVKSVSMKKSAILNVTKNIYESPKFHFNPPLTSTPQFSGPISTVVSDESCPSIRNDVTNKTMITKLALVSEDDTSCEATEDNQPETHNEMNWIEIDVFPANEISEKSGSNNDTVIEKGSSASHPQLTTNGSQLDGERKRKRKRKCICYKKPSKKVKHQTENQETIKKLDPRCHSVSKSATRRLSITKSLQKWSNISKNATRKKSNETKLPLYALNRLNATVCSNNSSLVYTPTTTSSTPLCFLMKDDTSSNSKVNCMKLGFPACYNHTKSCETTNSIGSYCCDESWSDVPLDCLL